MQVDLTTAKVDVHSGMAGGAVQNPARALAQLLATMWHPNNSVAIAGFYDNVRPITDADRWGLVGRAGVAWGLQLLQMGRELGTLPLCPT